MKKMMMALAALCVAGAASAVTVSWNDTTVSADTVTIESQMSIEGDGGFHKTNPAFSVKVGSSLVVSVTLEGNNNLAKWLVGKYYATSDKETVGTGSADFGNIIAEDDSDGINGTYSIKFVFSDAATGIDASVYIATVGGEGGELQYEQVGSTANITWVGDDAVLDFTQANVGGLEVSGAPTIVPEPTALALLALGVAGLALRRKAA